MAHKSENHNITFHHTKNFSNISVLQFNPTTSKRTMGKEQENSQETATTTVLQPGFQQWNKRSHADSEVNFCSQQVQLKKTKLKLTKYHSQPTLYLFDLKKSTFANFDQMSCVCEDCMITESRAKPTYCFEGCYFVLRAAIFMKWPLIKLVHSESSWQSSRHLQLETQKH